MHPFLARLAEPRPLLLDGGFGTELIAMGLPAGQPPERWVLARPEALAVVHRAYVEAGAEAVHACSFGANRLRLEPFGLADQIAPINREAVALARAAGPRWVLADLGPSGHYRPPVGRGDPSTWRAAFAEQAALLAAFGADALHVETMGDLREALVCLDAARSAAPGLPVLVSLTFDRKRRGFFTMMGDPLVASLQALAEAGAAAVGANCSITSLDMLVLAREALGTVGIPLVMQPNAGQPRPTPEGLRYDQPPAAFAADQAEAARLGVKLVGGCCGTNPSFIAALRQALAAEPA
ncbi:MAG: homocysteine S-methyltransferase family protein [Pseudomonadota bacterium]